MHGHVNKTRLRIIGAGLFPKLETRNPKPETPNPETRNPKLETQNPKPETRNPFFSFAGALKPVNE